MTSTSSRPTTLTRCSRLIALATLPWLALAGDAAADITYTVDLHIGNGGVTGQIVTDGTTGFLGTANIKSWTLNVTGGGVTTQLTSAGGQSTTGVVGNNLTATLSELTFNFS